MVTNYRRGYDFERRVLKQLEIFDYYVMRAGKSKGTFDLIAVPIEGKPLLIQCKKDGYVPKKERIKLLEAQKFDGIILIAYYKRPVIKYKKLDGREFALF